MTATKNRAKKASTTVAPEPKKRTRVIELDSSFAPLFDELSEVSLARAEKEDRERELKQEILEAVGMNNDRKETIAVRVAGAIRAKVGLRARTVVSAKDLADAFPEAFEATSREVEFQVLSGA